MFQFRLLFRVLGGAFTLQKGHLRFPTWKRLGAVLFFFPLYLLGILGNGLFLLLDELFFPAYRRQSVERAVFIIAIPRSATTFLFHQLAADSRHFTCFRTWELVFAPSICQKYLFRGLIVLDRKMGRPLYRLSLQFDRWVFGAFRGIHDMGLTKPEEDEGLFLQVFAASYLSFFFPDHPALDPYLLFDRQLPASTQRSLLAFYQRCLQRHNYVFNRKETRYFLSKNPTFVPKMAAIGRQFPQAKLLYPLRSPLSTIPATISLNAHIYAAFTQLKESSPLQERTRDMLLDWYEMAETALNGVWKNRHRVLPFREIVQQPDLCLQQIYDWLELEVTMGTQERFQQIAAQAKTYRSPHQYDRQAGVEEDIIRARLGHLIS